MLEVSKKRKVKGCPGEGGAEEEELSKSDSRVSVRGSVSLPGRSFSDTEGPGPRCSWLLVSLAVAGLLSASPLAAPRPSGGPAAVSGVEGGPGSGGGGGDGKVSGVNTSAVCELAAAGIKRL